MNNLTEPRFITVSVVERYTNISDKCECNTTVTINVRIARDNHGCHSVKFNNAYSFIMNMLSYQVPRLMDFIWLATLQINYDMLYDESTKEASFKKTFISSHPSVGILAFNDVVIQKPEQETPDG